MRALAVLPLLLSGCALYFGPDEPPAPDDDDVSWVPDAAVPDAPTGCGVCGRVVDVENGQVVNMPLSIRFYDAVAYAGGDNTELGGAVALGPAGTFQARGVPAPLSGWYAMVVDDQSAETDDLAPTVTVMASWLDLSDIAIASFRRTTDQAWAAAAGLPNTFTSREATLYTFVRDDGTPASGVTVLENNAPSTHSWVFADPTSSSHAQITAGSVTGADGSFVILGTTDPSTVTGTGGGSPGCEWSFANAPGRYMTLTVAVIPPSCKI